MAIKVGQIVQNQTEVNNPYMTSLINNMDASKRLSMQDYTNTSSTLNIKFLEDEVFTWSSKFKAGSHYYFKGKVLRRVDSAQSFNVYLLIEKEDTSQGTVSYQYLTKCDIAQVNASQSDQEEEGLYWVDVSFAFTPIRDTQKICFYLDRVSYKDNRHPTIICEDICEIDDNLHKTFGNDINELIKIGVQAYPSFKFMINGEDFVTGPSGIYELRNGLITVTDFAIITDLEIVGAGGFSTYYEYLKNVRENRNTDTTLDDTPYDNVQTSIVLKNSVNTRYMDKYIVDYMYKG